MGAGERALRERRTSLRMGKGAITQQRAFYAAGLGVLGFVRVERSGRNVSGGPFANGVRWLGWFGHSPQQVF